ITLAGPTMKPITRRHFLASSLSAGAMAYPFIARGAEAAAGPVIDIPLLTNYRGRTNAQLLVHHRPMGWKQPVLRPAGSLVLCQSTDSGRANGLGGAGAGGNETVIEPARQYPREFSFGANEVTDLPEARGVIEKYLKAGAIVIGEQKFR